MDARTAKAAAVWYATPAGRRAAGLLRAAIRPWLRTTATTRLLAIAPPPVLDGLDPQAIERLAVIDASGAAWPPGAANVVAAADPAQLPFVEAMFDQVLVVHALETTIARAFLRELWRVLAPAGEVILVVANRAGLWSLSETNPFGEGRPYGRRGLARTLDEGMFEVVAIRSALAAPPWRGMAWSEAPLARIAPGLAGVHVVRACKRDGLAPAGRVDALAGRLRPATASPQVTP